MGGKKKKKHFCPRAANNEIEEGQYTETISD